LLERLSTTKLEWLGDLRKIGWLNLEVRGVKLKKVAKESRKENFLSKQTRSMIREKKGKGNQGYAIGSEELAADALFLPQD